MSYSVIAPQTAVRPRSAVAGGPAERWLAPAVGLLAATPVVVATARALAAGWLPAGDQANIAVRAFDVFGSRTPLVGLHSDASAVTHHAVYSLGPMLFWLLALPARLGGPGALTLTMGLVNALAVVATVVLARRRGGALLMFATALALALMCRSLAPEVLHDVWNPSAGLLPLTLLIFVSWSLACGEHRLLPATVLLASFVVQCQLAFVPPVLALLFAGFVGLAVFLRAPRPRVRVWPWALAALFVLVACWTAPLVDQAQRHPGNLGEVLRTATTSTPKLGAAVGVRAVVRAVGVVPWWLQRPASPWDRKHEVRSAAGAAADVSCALILLGLLAVVALGLRRRRRELVAGGAIALLLCAALASIAATTPTMRVLAETLGYTMWSGSPIGMFAWLMLAWPAAELIAARVAHALPPHRVLYAAAAAATAVLAAAIAVGARDDYHRSEYRPLRAVYSALERNLPSGRTVRLIGALGNETFRFKMAARFALVRHGEHPVSPGTDTRLGSWYELDHRRYACTVWVADGARSPAPGAVAIAHTSFDNTIRSYPLTVWLAPAGCRASG